VPSTTDNAQDLATFRRDGVDEWAPQHVTAAEMRARGRSWPDVAEATGHAVSTVQKYKQIDGFDALVDHLQQKLRSERLDAHWQHGAPEGLDALRESLQALVEKRDRVLDQIDGGQPSPEQLSTLTTIVEQIRRTAHTYLQDLGAAKAQKVRAKLEAEKDVTGEYGEQHQIDYSLAFNDTRDPGDDDDGHD